MGEAPRSERGHTPAGLRVVRPSGGSAGVGILDHMFVRYYVELPLPFADVEATLLAEAEGWVPGLLRDAEDRGNDLMAEVGFGRGERRVEKTVEIHLGSPFRMDRKTLVPMTWRAAGEERLFPYLDADLEIGALGPTRTQLSISARYRPPMGPLGRAIDRALLHRVAEATIKDFLDRVGERLLRSESSRT
jgi:hypothetical protein